jgi:signal transduction histidine kinase
MANAAPPREAEPGRRGLWLGIVAFRFASFAWTVALVPLVGVRNPVLTTAALLALGVWIVAVTLRRAWRDPVVLRVDLVVSATLLVVVPFLMHAGDLGRGKTFFAAAYPISTITSWAAAKGVRGGLTCAAALFVPFAAARPLNGLAFRDLGGNEWISIVTGGVYYGMAGGVVGLLSQTLDRAAEDLRLANAEALRQGARAARLQERDRMARELHDSVLQTLAIVWRRGRELAGRASVPGREVARLADLARDQERRLRMQLQRSPLDAPAGTLPLRDVLHGATVGIDGIDVDVAVAGDVHVDAVRAPEVRDAVHEALRNVVRHAGASRATVFGDLEDDTVVVSVRDDGVGFVFDPDRIAQNGRLGLMQSMKGRIEDAGGSMRLSTAPGRGTEVEFRVPAARGEAT